MSLHFRKTTLQGLGEELGKDDTGGHFGGHWGDDDIVKLAVTGSKNALERVSTWTLHVLETHGVRER